MTTRIGRNPIMPTRRSARWLLALALTAGVLALAPVRAEAAPLTGTTNLDVTSSNSCAVVAGGQVRCWGENLEGQVGDGTAGVDRHTATTVLNANGTPLTGAASVSVGSEFACARMTNKQVRCWGRNHAGQLGNGTEDASMRAVVVRNGSNTAALTNVTQISVGGSHVCARRTDGGVRCWGGDALGQLGNGNGYGGSSALPVPVSNVAGDGNLTGVVQVTSAVQHSCARLSNGQVRCWGADYQGQIGSSAAFNTIHSRPAAVLQVDGTGNLGGATNISAGGHTTCAVLGSGQARCWGDGSKGELGEHNDEDRGLPVVVQHPGADLDSHLDNTALTGASAVSVGWDHVCFRMTNGQLRCGGGNNQGQLGDPALSAGGEWVPMSVRNASNTGVISGVTHVAAGIGHTCARVNTGAAFCWGDDSSGQVGNGAGVADADLPTLVQAP
jgi:alpha-tubulin suppressor-like RCC1 family protein